MIRRVLDIEIPATIPAGASRTKTADFGEPTQGLYWMLERAVAGLSSVDPAVPDYLNGPNGDALATENPNNARLQYTVGGENANRISHVDRFGRVGVFELAQPAFIAYGRGVSISLAMSNNTAGAVEVTYAMLVQVAELADDEIYPSEVHQP